MTMTEKLAQYFASGQAGLVLTSVEPEECLKELAAVSRASKGTDEPWELMFWDVADGLTDAAGVSQTLAPLDADDMKSLGLNEPPQKLGLQDVLSITLTKARARQYREDIGEMKPDDSMLYILCVRNFDRYLFPNGAQGAPDNVLLSLTQKLINAGQATRICLLMQTTPEFELPTELQVHCEYVAHELPDTEERQTIITELTTDDVSAAVLSATAGLSRAKTSQYAAEALASYGYLNPVSIFQKKAMHLSRSSKLDVWSPEFVSQVKLWPLPALEELQQATDVTMIQEETSATNKQLAAGEVRARIRYVQSGMSKRVEKWLDPMPKDEFEKTYRPERDFFSLKSVVGLTGLKQFLVAGFRADVPDRAKMKHVLMLGVPGTGKSFMMQCCSGEFSTPLSSMQASNLYSKWLGDTDKSLAKMLQTVEVIGGILAIDEFQRFLPQGGGAESGGVESRLLSTLLTWFNNQTSNLILSAANNISNLPDEITRSGRVDALMFVGFPGRAAKDAAWGMYMKRHELAQQQLPVDDYWVPADIMSCCRLAELQHVSIQHASRWITPSYEKNQKQMDELMRWAESAGCICAESGERFKHPSNQPSAASSAPSKSVRKIRTERTTRSD